MKFQSPVLTLLLCLTLVARVGARENPPDDRMNIVLILSDDQGMGDFASFGNDIVKTPNLDRLRSESLTFTRMYTAPICAPTRAALLTGRQNIRAGVWDTRYARMNLDTEEMTLAEVLRDGGYWTGLFGKWHLGYNFPMRPIDQGFDESVMWFGVDTRFDPVMEYNDTTRPGEGFVSDIYFDAAMDFMARNRDNPFFAFIATYLPHDYPGKQVPDAEISAYEDVPGLSQADKETYAMVTRLDRNVGLVLEKIDELGLRDNTLVIFLPDNGPDLLHPVRPAEDRVPQPRFNAGLRDGKGTVYEGGIRVPAFFRKPGLTTAGAENDAPVAHYDLMPTILDLVGLPLPEANKIDGRSLVALLGGQGNAGFNERPIFIYGDRTAEPDRWLNACVIEGTTKLVNGRQLYNLAEDPGESLNLAELYPDEVDRLRALVGSNFEEITSERDGFVSGRTIIGSPQQTSQRIRWWNQNDQGWPVVIESPGPFQFKIEAIQHDILSEDAELVITAGGTSKRYPIDPSAADAIIPGVTLPTGPTHLKISIDGIKEKRLLKYRQVDIGYRDVFVEQESNPDE